MTIRNRLYAAIVITITALGILLGVALWGMERLDDRFGRVQRAADDRALALQLKFDVTDFNGWQTAYGYDNGKSRPIFLASVARFDRNLARARAQLESPGEHRLLDRIEGAADEFMRLDRVAFAMLRAGRTETVRRILLGPEIEHFQRMAKAADALAALENARADLQERAFRDARSNALRLLIVSAFGAAIFVVILLVTSIDLVRRAERALERQPPERSP